MIEHPDCDYGGRNQPLGPPVCQDCGGVIDPRVGCPMWSEGATEPNGPPDYDCHGPGDSEHPMALPVRVLCNEAIRHEPEWPRVRCFLHPDLARAILAVLGPDPHISFHKP